MGAPALQTYVTGQGSVSGDNLNTFEQTCDNFAQLRAFIGTTGVQVYARGASAPNDGGQGAFYWDTNAVGPDNNFTIIIPPGAASGGWVRLTESNAGFYYAADTGTLNALAITLPSDLAGLPIGTVLFVNPAHTTTITNPTLSINGATGVVITTSVGGALTVGSIVLDVPAQIMIGPGGALWLLNPGGSVLGPYATAALGQLPGTGTNDNAGAGDIGEFLSQTASSVPLTTDVITNVATLALTAGDWDVWGQVQFIPAGSTTISYVEAGVSTTSASFVPIGPTTGSALLITTTLDTGNQQWLPTGQIRVSVAAMTNVYLVAQTGFGTATMAASGFIAARRAR